MTENTDNNKFDLWCIVEILGHQKLAGRCSEQNIAGMNMLRVDVPETETQPAFTKFIGGSSIYAISPVGEEEARSVAESLKRAPIVTYTVRELIEKTQVLAVKEKLLGKAIEEHPVNKYTKFPGPTDEYFRDDDDDN